MSAVGPSGNHSNNDDLSSFQNQYGDPNSNVQGLGRSSDATPNAAYNGANNTVGDSIPIDHSIQHYELPNLTQLLYDYTNKEKDLIQRCFRTGNHNALRELPNNLAPNQILKYMRDKQETNINFTQPNPPKVAKLSGGGLFQDYEFMPDSFDAFLKKKEDRMQNEQLQKKISDKPFVLGMDIYKWKYEDCFLPPEAKSDYVLPYLSNDDPYEVTHDEVLKAKWLHENKILHGDFKPAKNDRCMDKINKTQLPDVVNYIKKVIMIDWAEVNFIIGTNPDSFIEIKFDQKSVDTELGLKAYMNTLITTHEVISQFNLRKVLKFWGYKDEKHVYFMLAPQWIKFNPGHVYSSVLKMQLENMDKKKKSTLGILEENEKENDDDYMQNFNDSKDPDNANLMRIQLFLTRNSNLIKEPQLYSKDIEI